MSRATGIITRVAGNGVAGFAGDGGLATKASIERPSFIVVDSQSNIYFHDQSNFRVRFISALTGIISTVIGNGTFGE